MEFKEMLSILQNPPGNGGGGGDYHLFNEGWSHFLDRYRALIATTVKRFCGENKFTNASEYNKFIDDITYDVLEILIEKNYKVIRQIKATAEWQFKGYLFIVTKNESIKACKKIPPIDAYDDNVRADQREVVREFENTGYQRWENFHNMASSIRDKQGTRSKNRHRDLHIFLLSSFGGFSNEDISRALSKEGVTMKIVTNSIHRIKGMLNNRLPE